MGSYSPRNNVTLSFTVHCCGPGGSMRACHAADPDSYPSGQVSWVRFFRGFSSSVRKMSGSFRPPRFPNIIWPSLSSSIIIHYGRKWPAMLPRPKTSNIFTYVRSYVRSFVRTFVHSYMSFTFPLTILNLSFYLCHILKMISPLSFMQ